MSLRSPKRSPQPFSQVETPPPFGFTASQYDDDIRQAESRAMSATHRTEDMKAQRTSPILDRPEWDHTAFQWPDRLTDMHMNSTKLVGWVGTPCMNDGISGNSDGAGDSKFGGLDGVRLHGFPLKSPQRLGYEPNGVIGSSRAAVEKVASRSDGMAKGGRVVLDSGITGVIKWIGMLDSKWVQTEIFYGIKLDEGCGEHDGMYAGKRYFTTPPLHGAFVRFENIRVYLATNTTQPRCVGRFKSAASRGITDFVGSRYTSASPGSRSRSRDGSASPTRRQGSASGSGVRLEPLQYGMNTIASIRPTSRSPPIARDASGSAEAELRLRQQLLRAKLERAQALGEQLKIEEERCKREDALKMEKLKAANASGSGEESNSNHRPSSSFAS